jgi:hypothetical protein
MASGNRAGIGRYLNLIFLLDIDHHAVLALSAPEIGQQRGALIAADSRLAGSPIAEW